MPEPTFINVKPALGYTADQMHAFLLADRAARWQAPAGWKLVPVEPTLEMLRAAARMADRDAFGGLSAWPSDTYKAMLAAARCF